MSVGLLRYEKTQYVIRTSAQPHAILTAVRWPHPGIPVQPDGQGACSPEADCPRPAEPVEAGCTASSRVFLRNGPWLISQAASGLSARAWHQACASLRREAALSLMLTA